MLNRSLFTDDRVKLIFSNDDTEYTFAKDFLTSKFEYFEKALRPERWTEGQEQVVRFDHITVQTFASIHKWVTAQHINDPQCKITYWGWGMDLTERKLEHLFNLALAADYLAMRAYDPFEAWLNEGIALTLFEDRAALTQDLLDLVAGPDAHPRFGQSCLFWKTFVAAGVRPAMQDHMRFQQDKTVASAPACGHEDGYAAWDEALAYCSRLRKRSRNAHYAAAVLREINVTMREGRHQWTNWGWAAGPRERSWQVFDPLCEVIVSTYLTCYQTTNIKSRTTIFMTENSSPSLKLSTSDMSSAETPENGRSPKCQKLKQQTADGQSDKHFEGPVISIRFASDESDDNSLVFPRSVLVDNFDYFRGALRDHNGQPAFVEGSKGQLHLQDIPAHIFARLIKYVLYPQYLQLNEEDWENMEDENLDNLFTLVIAADYLGMNRFADLEEKIAERVALTLLGDRRALSSAHINRLASHNAFKSKLLWDVVVESGVRPILQEHLIEEYDSDNPYEKSWAEQLKHCQQLRDDNIEYAHGVAQRIPNTLKLAKVGGYSDSLLRFISFTMSHRTEEFSIDWAS
ncbi:hypothetical protein GE09DRAFT_1059600 [Coniochaeta sp. 2T2.1]|nr:hypothetical protein GE09DRAFT_1059600 [Coniochaeta sp. 2T2.1]